MAVHWIVELLSIVLVALGTYCAFGPYHDDRTWNLIRNSAKLDAIPLPSQEPTHFGLYALTKGSSPWTPALLFVPGHGGSWRQGINLCAYLEQKGAFHFYVADFHASASALHWSVVRAQAAFTAAAIDHLAGVHQGPKLVLGHSMGGRVALEALQSTRHLVDALILISTPVDPHPLLLEPRYVPKAYNLTGVEVYSLSGGATDPLVPMKSCQGRTLGQGLKPSRFLPLPAASNVYSSFSHVNLLFSRHSLHFLSRLLRAVAKGEVPLPSPWLRLSGVDSAVGDPAVMQVPDNISVMDPVKVVSELRSNETVLWKQPKMGGVFSFLLLEEPRVIGRRPESTTRGETFDATDRLNCNEIELTWRQQDAGAEWYKVPLMDMQFPAKVCLFQLRPKQTSPTAEVLMLPPKQRKKPLRRAIWAHWQEDPLEAPAHCGYGWLQMLLWPVQCQLPAGRAVVSRIVLPLPQLLPLDFRLREVSELPNTSTELPLILVSQAEREEDVRIAALQLRAGGKVRSGWASESQDPRNVFAPRFVGKDQASVFVIGHPELQLTIEVRSNVFSALAELLRTRTPFHTWLGACTCFSAQDLYPRGRPGSEPWLWAAGTVFLRLLMEVPTPATVFLCALDALLGLGLASLSRRVASIASSAGRQPASRSAGAISFVVLLIAAVMQPAGCMLLLIIGTMAAQQAQVSTPLLGTSSLLLGPYLLCELPSIIFAVWLLLGQQKEASAHFLQSKLDQRLPSSQHMASLWADSLFLGNDPDVRQALSLLPPAVTLCCCMVLPGQEPQPRAGRPAMLLLSVAVTVYAAQSSSRLWWACQPVFLAHMLLALSRKQDRQAKVE